MLEKIANRLFNATVILICSGYLLMAGWVFTGITRVAERPSGYLLSVAYSLTWPAWLAPTMAENFKDAQP